MRSTLLRLLRPCLGAALLLGLVPFLGCSDTPSGRGFTSCVASSDCDRGATTAGELCIDGACTSCFTDTACQSDLWYGATATCDEGRCTGCTPGTPGCRCDAEGACQGAECVAGTCLECTRGDAGCVCLDNGACDDGLTCLEGLCGACIPGKAACPCDNNACEGDLLCQSDRCVDSACAPGLAGCPCAADDACEAPLTCAADGLCRACTSDVEGCPCEDDGTCSGGLGCQDDACAPCSPALLRCPCAEDATCEGDLLCDAEDTTCRAALTCAEACAPNQRCTAGAPGVDATCLPECLPGFAWDGVGCVSQGATCVPDAAGSIAQACADLQRSCVQQGDQGACGPCLEGFAEDSAATCRPLLTCADLACDAEGRLCTDATSREDATCGACAPPRVEQGGACVAGATCTPAVEGSIVDACAALRRACAESQPGLAACGACEAGLIPDDPDDAASPCREPIRCADRAGDPELDCPAGTTCYDLGSDEDSDCRTRACLNPREAYNATTQRCELCQAPASCSGSGETGELGDLRTESGACVCETRPEFYVDLSEGATGRACDRDGDGWITLNAWQALTSPDPVIRDQARCTVRLLDRITLQNEWGQRLDVYACQGAEPWTTTACPGSARFVPLVEPRALDDASAFEALISENTVPEYRRVDNGNIRGRRLRVEELNPLTKACISPVGDFNANGRADLSESQTAPPNTTLPGELRDFSRFAAFVELHRFAFEALPNTPSCPDGATCGRLVISERSRREVAFPITPEANSGDYWRDCTRGRDAAYTESTTAPEPMGFDFGRFIQGCTANVGGCPLPPPPIDAARTTTEVLPHGLGDLAASLPINATFPWRGMTHHSQFKCVLIDTTVDTNAPGRLNAQHRLHPSELYNAATGEGRFTLNRCGVACPSGDASCAQDCPASTCDPATRACTCAASSEAPAQGSNPWAPRLSCVPVDTAEALLGVESNTVGFAAVRYLHGNGSDPSLDYIRGCINEWRPQSSASTVAAWRSLCPGYREAPRTTFGLANLQDYGRILCGCNVNYGGPACLTGCEDPLYGGPASSPCADNNGYCPVRPDGDGGRLGAWICGEVTATSLPPDAPPFLQNGPALIEGGVHLKVKPLSPMCAGGGSCANASGPVIR